MSNNSYLLHISLVDAPKPIWRRFVVPAHIKLNKLHLVLQTVMGWRNKHLYSFFAGQQQYLPKNTISEGTLCGDRFPLHLLAPKSGVKFQYLYDFSDRWMHEIVVKNHEYIDLECPWPVYCLDGSRACPPEECGGMDAFGKICEALRDKNHPRHHEYKKQDGRLYYPDRFQLKNVNAAFGIRENLNLLD